MLLFIQRFKKLPIVALLPEMNSGVKNTGPQAIKRQNVCIPLPFTLHTSIFMIFLRLNDPPEAAARQRS